MSGSTARPSATREALAIECHRRINADRTVKVLDRLACERGITPGFIRCDNGPEMPPTPCGTGAVSPEPGALHRARLALAKPARRLLQRPHPRRAPLRRAVLLPSRSPSLDRGLALRLQPPSPALLARDDDPECVRRGLPQQPSHDQYRALSARRCRTRTGGKQQSTTTSSHNRWTDNRGPVTIPQTVS